MDMNNKSLDSEYAKGVANFNLMHPEVFNEDEEIPEQLFNSQMFD